MNNDPAKCKNSPDDFCYVCGEYSLGKMKKRLSNANARAYLSYFGHSVSDLNRRWVPHFVCRNCHLGLLRWMNDCGGGLKISKPMYWREPKNHFTDCYFCVTNIDVNTGVVNYANVMSVTKPIANNTVVSTQNIPNNLPIVPKPKGPQLICPNDKSPRSKRTKCRNSCRSIEGMENSRSISMFSSAPSSTSDITS